MTHTLRRKKKWTRIILKHTNQLVDLYKVN
jgi:hypothetical protein